ncbi:helix-turn-helix transcriptional regulator [Pedobacter sp.]
MQLFSFVIPLAQLAILVCLLASFCYQLAVFLCSAGQGWRIWRLLLLGILLLYDTVVAIIPNEELSVSLPLQYIVRYGIGFALWGCLPLYFYKAHGMAEFTFHLRFGVPICYGLSFLVFFCAVLPLGGDLELVLFWGMILPFLCALSSFVVLALALYRQWLKRSHMHLAESLDEMALSCISVGPWVLATCCIFLEVEVGCRVLLMNVGFVLAWILTVARDVRRKLVELRLSRHATAEDQLTFQDRCAAHGLSKRETEVAELLCAGLTYREIGEQLYISLHTVDNHVRHIFTKTGVNRKMDLYAKLRPGHNG